MWRGLLTYGAGFSDNSVQDPLLSRRSVGKRGSGYYRAAFTGRQNVKHVKNVSRAPRIEFKINLTAKIKKQRAADWKPFWWKLTIEHNTWGVWWVCVMSQHCLPFQCTLRWHTLHTVVVVGGWGGGGKVMWKEYHTSIKSSIFFHYSSGAFYVSYII